MLNFRLFGVPFGIHWSFWVFSAILSGVNPNSKSDVVQLVVWVLCVLVSIVVHELGHALSARHYGVQPRVLLQGLGGVTYFQGAMMTRGQSILISLAGPAMGFALWAVVRLSASHVFPLLPPSDVLLLAVSFLGYINLVWTIFNLLPILPLDGGQVLRDVLGPSLFMVTRIIGTVCAVVLCVIAFKLGIVFTAIFLGYLAYANWTGDTRAITGGVQRGG